VSQKLVAELRRSQDALPKEAQRTCAQPRSRVPALTRNASRMLWWTSNVVRGGPGCGGTEARLIAGPFSASNAGGRRADSEVPQVGSWAGPPC